MINLLFNKFIIIIFKMVESEPAKKMVPDVLGGNKRTEISNDDVKQAV